MANSHEGNLSLAKKITKAASESGADAIKYQKFTPDELAEPSHELYNLYQNLQMTEKNWKHLISYAKSLKLDVFVDVFGLKSAKSLSKYNITGFKIHSSDTSNPYILNYFAKISKPILFSTAGCSPKEIENAINILSTLKKEIVLMHGFQGYPTKLEDLHLSRLTSLKEKFDLPVGLMDHISGDSKLALISPLVGIAKGATVIEKHITLDRKNKGLDYFSALNPDEFKEFVKLVKLTEKSLGNNSFEFGKNETKYRLTHKKNPVAKVKIPKNTNLDYKMFNFVRTSVKQNPISSFTGKKLLKSLQKGEVLTETKVYTNILKVAAVIACRVDSSRLFAKPLQLIDKQPILALLINQIKKSKKINDIVLAISENPGNEFFIDFAKKRKIKYVIGNDTDVLNRLIIGAQYVDADIVFRVTAENPFIYWEGIDKVISDHIQGKYDFSVVEDIPLGSGYEVINRAALEISHAKGQKRHRSELCSLYIFENKNKFKINRFKPAKNLQRPDLRLTVDTPQDLWLVRLVNQNIQNSIKPIKLSKIIQFLDSNPEIAKLNSDIPIGKSRIW